MSPSLKLLIKILSYVQQAVCQDNDKYALIHLTGIFLDLNLIGLFDMSPEEIIEKAKENIMSLKSKGELKVSHLENFPSDAAGGYGYKQVNSEIMQTFFLWISEQVELEQQQSRQERAKELLQMLPENFDRFSNIISLNPTDGDFFDDEPLLQHIDAQEFVEVVSKLSNANIRKLGGALKSRYTDIHNHPKLITELTWLKDVALFLEKAISKRKNLLSGFMLLRLKQAHLDPIILSLEDFQTKRTL